MSVHKLARRFKLDVSTDNTTWIPFKGITDLQVKENATVVDVTDYDTNGFTAKEKTLSGATITVKADGPLNAGVADPGQEIVRATQYQFGTAARVYGISDLDEMAKPVDAPRERSGAPASDHA